MENKNIDLYWFSGTGNTKIAVNELYSYFEKNKFNINRFRIEKSNPEEINTENALGLAFPIAYCSTYPFIWDFIEKIPETYTNTEVFLLTTLGGYSGGILAPLKKMLKKKGYNPIGAKEIIMPNNFSSRHRPTAKTKSKIVKGKHQAKRFAHDLHYDLAKWVDVPVVNRVLYKVSRMKKTIGYMQKKFVLELDEIKCTRCAICYKLCPVDNIRMYEFPEFLDKCQLCMRCYSYCPANAITFENKILKRYKGVDVKELLKD